MFIVEWPFIDKDDVVAFISHIQLQGLVNIENLELENNSDITGTIPTEIGVSCLKLCLPFGDSAILSDAYTFIQLRPQCIIQLLNRLTKFDAYENNLVGAIPTEVGLLIALV